MPYFYVQIVTRILKQIISKPLLLRDYFKVLLLLPKIRNIIPKNSSKTIKHLDLNATLQSLTSILSRHGSDKATHHNYDLFYFDYLQSIKNSLGIVVEIGIGSNDPSIPSNMGINGVPGASLRAFRDFLPNMQIIGADIDQNILFNEERIKTFFLDQLRLESFDTLLKNVPEIGSDGIDLVVIDGLHEKLPDLNSVVALLPHLKVGAKLFVEDVFPSPVNELFWKFTLMLINKKYYLTKINITRSAYLIEIERFN